MDEKKYRWKITKQHGRTNGGVTYYDGFFVELEKLGADSYWHKITGYKWFVWTHEKRGLFRRLVRKSIEKLHTDIAFGKKRLWKEFVLACSLETEMTVHYAGGK